MSAIGSYGELDYPDGDSSRAYLRNEFLRTIAEIRPEVLEELYNGPFQFFMQHIRQLNLDISQFTSIHALRWRVPEVETLFSLLQEWLNSRNLNARWCMERALWTLRTWSYFSRRTAPLHFDHDAWGGCSPTADPPPDGLTEYDPVGCRRQTYLHAVRARAEKIMRDNPLLLVAHPSHRNALLDSLEKEAESYCKKVEDLYLLHGFVRSVEGSNLKRDLEWTVRFQVLKESFSDIASSEGVEVSTVTRPVTALLKRLGLTKRPDATRGRKRGSRNKPDRSSVVKRLGK